MSTAEKPHLPEYGASSSPPSSSYAAFAEIVQLHHPLERSRSIRRNLETFPSTSASARLEVDVAGWQRFSRTLDTELWVSLVLDDPAEALFIRPAFALGARQGAPLPAVQRKVEKAVARFNRDIAKAERLAKIRTPRWRDRLRKRLGL